MTFVNLLTAKLNGLSGKNPTPAPKQNLVEVNLFQSSVKQGENSTATASERRYTASSLPSPKSAAVQNLSPAKTPAANKTQPSTTKQTPTFSEKMSTHKQKCGSFIFKVHVFDPTYIILTGAACVCSGIFLAGAAIYEGIRSRSS
jgi:triacylglycerol esterase/lipase EstA (alpha/beta hydrolase family)